MASGTNLHLAEMEVCSASLHHDQVFSAPDKSDGGKCKKMPANLKITWKSHGTSWISRVPYLQPLTSQVLGGWSMRSHLHDMKTIMPKLHLTLPTSSDEVIVKTSLCIYAGGWLKSQAMGYLVVSQLMMEPIGKRQLLTIDQTAVYSHQALMPLPKHAKTS